MAERKKTKGRPAARRKRPVRRRSLFNRLRSSLSALQKPKAEFREDASGTALLKLLHITRLQRLRLLRWTLYIVTCILALVLQDVIMSRLDLFNATTDLAPAVILLIAILEGTEVGSVFALLASIVYFFSGTAPGAYCVGFITILAILLGLFRQNFWHRSAGSIIMCTGIAVIIYELGLYGAGLFLGLTRWNRIVFFLLTGLYNTVLLIPIYQLVYRIGLIGGNIWKE